jgi:hypothetical protein
MGNQQSQNLTNILIKQFHIRRKNILDFKKVDRAMLSRFSHIYLIQNNFDDLHKIIIIDFKKTLFVITSDANPSISGSYFRGLKSLQILTIYSPILWIEWSCFYNCSSLTSITIPNSVISFGDSCFQNCSSLTSITIPNSVTSVGQYCFEGCLSLQNFSLSFETPPNIPPWRDNEKAKPFFPHCSTDVFVECPFKIK